MYHITVSADSPSRAPARHETPPHLLHAQGSKSTIGDPEEEGRTLVKPEPELCDVELEEEEGRRKEDAEKSEEKELEEDEEFCNKVQHAEQATAVEERPTKKAKIVRKSKK